MILAFTLTYSRALDLNILTEDGYISKESILTLLQSENMDTIWIKTSQTSGSKWQILLPSKVQASQPHPIFARK